MGTTERVLTVVIAAGLAGCLGLFAMNTGPRAARASEAGPVESPGVPESEEPGVSAMNDPLTESVERFEGPAAVVRFPKNLVLEPGSFTTAFRPESGLLEGAGEADTGAVREVMFSRLVALGGEPVFAADFDGDHVLNESDMGAFEEAWGQGDGRADFNADGQVDAADFADFLSAYESQEKREGGGNVIELRLGGMGEQEVQIETRGTVTFQVQLAIPVVNNP